MKKKNLMAYLLAGFLLSTASFVNAEEPSGVTTVNMLKMRKGPSIREIATGAYPVGQSVKIIGISEDNRWLRVKISGQTGYMWRGYIRTDNSFALSLPLPTTTGTSDYNGENETTRIVLIKKENEALKKRVDDAKELIQKKDAEIISLKEQVSQLTSSLNKTKLLAESQEKRLATMEKIRDFRLIGLVEMSGEDMYLDGVGLVKMARLDSYVVFRVNKADTEKAVKALNDAEKNTHIVGEFTYFTTEVVNIQTGK